MRKFALVGLAALIAFTTFTASYTPAQAQSAYGYNRGYQPQRHYTQPRRYHGNNAGAVAAGLLGAIVIGAMVAGAANAQPVYNRPVPMYGAGHVDRCQTTRVYDYDQDGRQIFRNIRSCR